MAREDVRKRSFYQDSMIVLATKHEKSKAIAPLFLEKLGANVIECKLDTDLLGTFSGEVERNGNALECARKKCEWSLESLGESVEFALASEGSFGPHPFIPFCPCDHEFLYFIDRRRGFHLSMSYLSEKTNYWTGEVTSLEEVYSLIDHILFPSHALILRPNNRETKTPIFKGLNSKKAFEEAFDRCLKESKNGKVWVETDMRAHLNPTRMKVIEELVVQFTDRLLSHCPACNYPGWGKIRYEKGLICRDCGFETELVKSQVFGCVNCIYEERSDQENIELKADPAYCIYCNP